MEFIAGEVIIMQNGSILKIGTTEKLLQEVEGKVWISVVSHSQLNSLKKQFAIGNIIQRSNGIEVRMIRDQKPAFPCEAVKPILEDVFSYCFGGNVL